jgi:O-methyltransferase
MTSVAHDSRPPKGRLNRPLPLRRVAQQPSWIFKDLAPMGPEVRRPLEYAHSVMLWREIRQRGYTMLGCRRGRTLYRLAREADRQSITGALVDCGVWNGGSTALLSAGAPSREVYAFDSFEGLPPSDEQLDGEHSVDREGWCLGVQDNVRDALRRFGSPERLHIVKGWFEDTFPVEVESIGPIAVLHADGDWYASVRLTLETFYDRISPGGFVAVDDYGVWSGARQAVDEFRESRAIAEHLVRVEAAAYWRKSAP